MKKGQKVKEFCVVGKQGKPIKVVLRYPLLSDAKEALLFCNRARDQADFLGMRKHETLKSEKKWLSETIAAIGKKKSVFLFAVVDEKIVGSCDVRGSHFDISLHCCSFGIMLLEEFTGIGIGTALAKKVIELAKKDCGFSIIESNYASENKRSAGLHKKLGFKKCGCFPKGMKLRNGKYCDQIEVFKFLKKIGD